MEEVKESIVDIAIDIYTHVDKNRSYTFIGIVSLKTKHKECAQYKLKCDIRKEKDNNYTVNGCYRDVCSGAYRELNKAQYRYYLSGVAVLEVNFFNMVNSISETLRDSYNIQRVTRLKRYEITKKEMNKQWSE